MSNPHFSVAATIVVGLLATYFATLGPIWGRRGFRWLQRTRPHRPEALERYYRRFMITWWVVALTVPLVLALSPGLSAEQLGVGGPHGELAALIFILLGPMLLAFAVGGVRAKRRILAGEVFPARQAIAVMLPGTRRERLLAVGVCVTAGIVEELFFRGLLISAGVGVLGLPVLVAALLALMLFAVGHLYQGRRGILGVGYLGLIFTILYLASGTLLPGIIAHTFIDLNALVLIPASTPEQIRAADQRAAAAADAAIADELTAEMLEERDLRPAAPGGE